MFDKTILVLFVISTLMSILAVIGFYDVTQWAVHQFPLVQR